MAVLLWWRPKLRQNSLFDCVELRSRISLLGVKARTFEQHRQAHTLSRNSCSWFTLWLVGYGTHYVAGTERISRREVCA